jgi:uncharacterized NAD-dependent epimerase/dehydratase family protein
MAETLGILVTTDKHLESVIELVDAAREKGKDIQAFFTGAAVHLTVHPDFAKLAGKAKIWICDVSFRANGLHGREEEVPGVDFKSFATQGRNAEMLAESDRYVVF